MTTANGPNVVAVGGGHGVSTTLRATRDWAGSLTAIVSVADDGGSTGRLRRDLGLPAPGDLRRCLAALADPTSVLGRSLDHRFGTGELEGHAVGNLLIAGLVDAGSPFVDALDEVGRLIGAVGRVLPAASEPVSIAAEATDGPVTGQVAVERKAAIHRLALVPPNPASPPDVAEAIADADLVVLGPGSLYTSVLAAALVPAVRDALAKTNALVAHVVNLANSSNTLSFAVADHVAVLRDHGVRVDVAVADPQGLVPGTLPEGVAPVWADLAEPGGRTHDHHKLGETLRLVAGVNCRPRVPLA